METKTEKTGKSAEGRKLNLRLARFLFRQAWTAENPSGSPEERKAAFKEAQSDYLKQARKMKKQLQKAGVELSLAVADPEADAV